MHGQIKTTFHLLIPSADPGPAQVMPGWELTGLALAQTNPIVPRVARLAIWDERQIFFRLVTDSDAVWDLYGIQAIMPGLSVPSPYRASYRIPGLYVKGVH